MSTNNNKRIAKNTFYLYLRMLMVMLVNLYTMRIVINALGATDYGINNVVGGFVIMFTFLTTTLNAASLRFFSINIGRKDNDKTSLYFTMSSWCYMIVALIVLTIAETAGLWFVSTQLNIPQERYDAGLWVYHFSILTFVLNILAVPFSTLVIAHERMNMYALLGILECILKLGVAFIISVSDFDKLKTYSTLTFLMMAVVNTYYVIYGFKHFQESHIRCIWDGKIFREIANYSGWTLFGAISGVLRDQGINILLNIFFNPIVNAARAIAYQVNACVNQFVINFYNAVQPQINKRYGAGEITAMHSLVLSSSRLCFYLILLLSTPLLLQTEYILQLWLVSVPENTVLFTRLVIIIAIIDSTSYPLQSTISATGRIKYFQMVTGGLLLTNLPISWFLLRQGFPPEATMFIAMALSVLAQATRIFFANRYARLSVKDYVCTVLGRIIPVTVIAYIIPVSVTLFVSDGLLDFILTSLLSIMSCIITIWLIGITSEERDYLYKTIRLKLHV